MKHDSGAIEFNAVLFLFFVTAAISGGVLFAAAGITHLQTNSRDFEVKTSAGKLLDDIIAEMQPMALYQYDDKNNPVLTGLRQKYEEYKLEITDVSSGYHPDFLSDADMADSSITEFLFRDRTGSAFSLWLRANGLTVSKDEWREFINEEAWNACASYGWLHKNDLESFAFRSISGSFGTTAVDKLFPLVNDFPRMNINMVNPEIIYPLITRGLYNIEKAKEKADTLSNRLRSGPVLHADISQILNIPVNHPLMGYLGTKTAFWKISFIMRNSLEVEAIAAAIPKKEGTIQEIEIYRLIDRSFFTND
jgi:hypothetical protein